jgi:alkylation response protein AidB-like acyl-CoA dehydrogenase
MSNSAALDALDDEGFRAAIRAWVAANYPEHLRFPSKRLHFFEVRDWYLALSRQGWLAPGWPREHGGMGLSPIHQLILIEEFERHGVARLPDHGIIMLGPLLIRFGTSAQQQRFLPKILSGEEIWCQGYSEPNAGSDLASLRTEAVLDGDAWVINGQKTWTTLATDAQWMFLLARTDKTVKKQNGISFLLVPLDSPGVTVRPIINLEMHDEYCEVFFEDVRVPKDNLVGEVNQGWAMAKALLGFERIFFGSPKQSAFALERLRGVAQHLGVWEDPLFREKYTRLHMDLADHGDLFQSFADQLRRDEALGPDVSMLKLNQTELYQRITDLMLEIAGENGGLMNAMEDNRALNPSGFFIQARPTTIYGGTSEIQRGIIAREVLKLPA